MARRRRLFSFRLGRSARVLLAPARKITPLAERMQIRLMGDILTVLLPLFALMAIASVVARRQPLTSLSYAIPVVLIGGTAFAWKLARTNQRLGAAVLVAINILGAFLAGVDEHEPVRALAADSFAVLGVLYASFLLSPRATVAAAVSSLGSVFLLPLLNPRITFRDVVIPAFFQAFLSSLVAVTAYLRERQRSQLERRSEALQEAERRLRVTMDSSLDAVVTCDESGRVVEWSRQAQAIFGYTRDEALREELVELCFPEDGRGEVSRLLEQAMGARGLTVHRELEARRQDGAELPVELSASGLELRGRQATAVFLRDLSERRKIQADLVQSDRLISVGRLAAGVAHEINNPMTYVLSNLQLAVELTQQADLALGEKGADLAAGLKDALDGAQRVQTIVRDLRTFSRAQTDEARPARLEQVLESAVRIAWNEIRHRARLVKRYGRTGPVVVNESRLGQVFLNLLMNAVQAFLPRAEGNEIILTISTLPDQRVAASVADNGPGIAPEVKARLFAPFFTTKPPGQGTGLGLYLSRGIVRGLGGDLTVDSTVGRGSTFTVTLPPASWSALAKRPPEPPRSTACQTHPPLSILVVDDDPRILRVLERMLVSHRVTACESGAQALEHSVHEAFDLVLCDVMMPGMNGFEVARQLVERRGVRPEQVVFMSANVLEEIDGLDASPSPERWLDKPLELEKLNEVLVHAASQARAVPEAAAAKEA